MNYGVMKRRQVSATANGLATGTNKPILLIILATLTIN